MPDLRVRVYIFGVYKLQRCTVKRIFGKTFLRFMLTTWAPIDGLPKIWTAFPLTTLPAGASSPGVRASKVLAFLLLYTLKVMRADRVLFTMREEMRWGMVSMSIKTRYPRPQKPSWTG